MNDSNEKKKIKKNKSTKNKINNDDFELNQLTNETNKKVNNKIIDNVIIQSCSKKNDIKLTKNDKIENNLIINIKNNKSPLRYPGGKTRACKILDENISKYFTLNNFDTILSPFFGGGSFEFYFQNTYNKKIIANDKFTPLYNFWKQIKCDNLKLYNELKDIKNIKKEDFQKYREEIMNLNNDMLKQAKLYFIINRCSFSGATLSGGFSEEASKKRFTESSKEKIFNLDLTDFEIYNSDFKKFIDKYYIENKTLMFLDPPYYLEEKSNLYGKNGDLHETFDHQKLYDTIKKKKWIMTYNDCEYIRNLYSQYLIFTVNWSYGMNKSKKSSELIIINNI